MLKLPADLRTDDAWLVGGGAESSCFGGIRGSTKGVRAHMGNARSLPRGTSGGRCRGSGHIAGSAISDKSTLDLLGDVKLTTGEGPRPCDCLTRACIGRSFRLEQPQHALCTVCCPHRDDPPVGFAQRLRRPHTLILPRISLPAERLSVSIGPPGALRSRPLKKGEPRATRRCLAPRLRACRPVGLASAGRPPWRPRCLRRR